MKILVVEDEKGMAQVLRRGLEEDNHAVSLAHDGLSALSLSQDTQFDLVLLDVMLPGINGIQVARRFRELRQDIPILMLTARDSVPDIVKGLDSGADDYVTKPFSFAVLLARIRALERRVAESRTHTLRVCDLALEITQRRVFRGTREIQGSPRRNFACSNSSCATKDGAPLATPSSMPYGCRRKTSKRTLWMPLSASFAARLMRTSPYTSLPPSPLSPI